MRHAITIAMLLMFLVACGQRDEVATAKQPAAPAQAPVGKSLTPEQMGELGAQISRQPDRANELLAQHGLTVETFEKEIRRITEDPQASRRYAEAYKRTKV